jgi:hypothetical protein
MAGELRNYEDQLQSEIKSIPAEYLPNLLQIVRVFRSSVMLGPAEDSFQKGWQEAVAGDTHPVSVLWDGINAE